MDEYEAAQIGRGENPTVEHKLLAQAVSRERGMKIRPKDIMKAQGLDLDNTHPVRSARIART